MIAVAASVSAAAAPIKVVVLPISIHSTVERDVLQRGLADMLLSRLGQHNRIAVIPTGGVGARAAEVEAARERARALGAQYVVFGSFTHFGEGASLDLVCAEVAESDPGHRKIFVQAGTLGEIIPKLDTLAARITSFISGEPAPIEPSSAEASLLRDLQHRVEALEKALPLRAPGDEHAAAHETPQPAGVGRTAPVALTAPRSVDSGAPTVPAIPRRCSSEVRAAVS